jgi:DNA polymerase sigma
MDLKVDFLCSFYGSTISGLSIENSDIDILVKIKENKQEKNYLKNIMNDLVAQLKTKNINFINNINPILSASVPVIKLECDLCNDESFSHEINTLIKKYDLSYNDITKLYFDITFFEVENEQNKIPSELMIDYIKDSLMIYPKIIDIIYIMKKYLLNRKLNKSYQGGISSYSLFLLTLSFFKYFKNYYDIPIGSLLIEYLRYYSTLDFYSTVIQPNKDDNIYSLIEGNSNFRQYKLNIIDPITGLNVAKSTFKIEQIKEAFAEGLNNINFNLYTINNNENMNNINGHKKILDIFLAK